MRRIVFDSFNKTPGNITFNIKTYEDGELLNDDEIYFKFTEKFMVDDNIIAIALTTFCGVVFDEIYFDLTLHEDTVNNIAKYTHANVLTKLINNEKFISENRNKIALNFSGGFDSLAAKILLGDYVELVSISFFDIEYNFFKKFKPHMIETNFRKLGYARNSWTFMGVGSILYSEFLNFRYLLFGTVLESSYPLVVYDSASRKVFNDPPFSYAGVDTIKFIQSMTEIGTALVLCNTYPFLVNDSLVSLSNPDTEKRYRKQLIIDILKEKFNLDDVYLEYTEPPSDERKLEWGKRFAMDFLILYILKNSNIEKTSKLMKNIPQEAVDFVENFSLEFYEKYNVNLLNNIPIEIRSEVTKNLAIAGIFPYDENDYVELKEVIKFLSTYYSFLSRVCDKF